MMTPFLVKAPKEPPRLNLGRPAIGAFRYFAFTRVNPEFHDFSLLVRTCHCIGAFFAYRVVYDHGRWLLFGFIVLRFPVAHLERLFPNFILTEISHDLTSVTRRLFI